MSRRGRAVRRMVYESGRFSAGLDGTGIAAAAVASSPKLALFPDRSWTIRDRIALHSDILTPKRAAAAASSISRAAAPATVMPYCPVPRTDEEPPVAWVPNQRARRYAPQSTPRTRGAGMLPTKARSMYALA